MTRAFVVLLEGKKITAATYIPGDAYPDGEGLEVLKAIKEDRLGQYIAQKNQDPEISAECEGICPAWYTRAKGNKDPFFLSYTYLYDCKNSVVEIRNYGNLQWRFKVDRLDEYMKICEHYAALWYAYSYSEETLGWTLDGDKLIGDRLSKGETADQIVEFAQTVDPAFILEDRPHRGTGCFTEDQLVMIATTQHRGRENKQERQFKFYIYSDYGISVVLQLPYIRARLSKVSSLKNAVKYIREYVRAHEIDLYVMADIYDLYEGVQRDIGQLKGEERGRRIQSAEADFKELFGKLPPMKIEDFSVRGCLAPLLMQWHGIEEDEAKSLMEQT